MALVLNRLILVVLVNGVESIMLTLEPKQARWGLCWTVKYMSYPKGSATAQLQLFLVQEWRLIVARFQDFEWKWKSIFAWEICCCYAKLNAHMGWIWSVCGCCSSYDGLWSIGFESWLYHSSVLNSSFFIYKVGFYLTGFLKMEWDAEST